MPRIRSITIIIPPAYPDPLRAWTEIDRIGGTIIPFPSTLRCFRIVTAPEHIRCLSRKRTEWFTGVQRYKWILELQKDALIISVPGERGNGVDQCSAALRLLFPALHAHGLLAIEFPSQRE